MTPDLSMLDSTIALINGTDEITEEHARVAAEVMDSLPVEAFKDGAKRLTTETVPHRDRVTKLNILMSKQPAWNSACQRYAKWKEESPIQPPAGSPNTESVLEPGTVGDCKKP